MLGYLQTLKQDIDFFIFLAFLYCIWLMWLKLFFSGQNMRTQFSMVDYSYFLLCFEKYP